MNLKTMTMQQIETRFPGEWILVGDPETNDAFEVLRGTVLSHSKDRDEVYRAAIESSAKHIAVLYNGEMPENTAIVL